MVAPRMQIEGSDHNQTGFAAFTQIFVDFKSSDLQQILIPITYMELKLYLSIFQYKPFYQFYKFFEVFIKIRI